MIYVDEKGHLVTDGHENELHVFARSIGLRREWFQDKPERPHYDLTTTRSRNRALKAGALLVTGPRAIVKVLRGEPMVPCDTCGLYDSKYDMTPNAGFDICPVCWDNLKKHYERSVPGRIKSTAFFNTKDVVNPT